MTEGLLWQGASPLATGKRASKKMRLSDYPEAGA